MKKWLIIPGLLLAALLIFRTASLLFKGSGGGRSSGERPPVAVQADSVRIGPIQEVRQFTGTVYPRYQYLIAPKVSGRVMALYKRIGDPIAQGEIIARMDDAEYQQAVREAEASLRIAQASLMEAQSQFELAAQELERVQSLNEKGIASSSELDAATTQHMAQKSRLSLARAQVEQREAALRSAQIRLDYTVLKASEPGFAGQRFVDEGSLLSPNAPLLSVLGIDKVIIRTTIIERDYGRIQVGQQTDVTVDAFPDRHFTGQVARIAPMLQQASRMAEMEIEVDNRDLLLKPGMFSRVFVILSEKDEALLVPTHAVVSRDGAKGVYAVDESTLTVRYVPIEAGIVTAEWTEVTSPALQGRVVTLGQHLLAEGSKILLPQQANGEKEGGS